MSDVMPEFTSVHLNQISDTAPTPPHFFQEFPNHWCLFFLCTGTATFFVSGGTYAVGGGDILLCPPGLCHAVIPSGNSHSVLLVFRTTPPCTGLTSCRLFSVRSHPDILSILRMIQNPSILMPAKGPAACGAAAAAGYPARAGHRSAASGLSAQPYPGPLKRTLPRGAVADRPVRSVPPDAQPYHPYFQSAIRPVADPISQSASYRGSAVPAAHHG